MKRRIFLTLIVTLFVVALLSIFVACNNFDNISSNTKPGTEVPGGEDQEGNEDSPEEDPVIEPTIYYTVSFDSQGGSAMEDIMVERGHVIEDISCPSKQCAILKGFALDPLGDNVWHLTTDLVTSDIHLFAIWQVNHTWGEWETIISPNCVEEGERMRECSICDLTETEKLAPLGHDYSGTEWEYDDLYHREYCTRCGNEGNTNLHQYNEEGVCEVCLHEVTPYSEFQFVSLGNNTWEIAKYNGNRNYVSLPSIYNNGTVIAVGDEAFSDNISLSAIDVPDSILCIGNNAFAGCTSLTSITIPDSVTSIGMNAFYGCNSLSSITLSNNLTTIGDRCFCDCTSIESIVIPDSVDIIGANCFYGCTNLTEITLPNSIETIKTGTFKDCVSISAISIPNSVTSIEANAFENCSALSSVHLSNGVQFIGDSAFKSCGVLNSLILPNTILSLSNNVFYNCISIESIVIPDSVTSIGMNAFYGCKSLSSITLSNNLTTIGNGCFYSCTSIESIVIPDSVTSIGMNAFYGCNSLSSITLSDNLTTIGDRCFYDCTSIESIVIPDSVTSIGMNAFYGCNSLSSITLSDNLTTIGDRCFYDCTALASIVIPANVIAIEDFAFYGNESLYSFYFIGTTLQWSNIIKGNNWRLGCPFADVICLSDYREETAIIKDDIFVFELRENGEWVNNPELENETINSGREYEDGYWLAEYTGTEREVIIPSTYNDRPVVGILNGVFAHFNMINTETKPNKIIISDGIKHIDSNVFNNYMSDSLCLIIPNSVITIGENAIQNCIMPIIFCEAVSKPEGWDENFIGNFSSSLSQIVWDYKNNANAKTFEGEDGDIFIIEDGIYYEIANGEAGVMNASECITKAIVPSTITYNGINYDVTKIYANAFKNCESLSLVVLNDNLITIEDNAFENCKLLSSIIIPTSVTSIGKNVFKDCINLVYAYLPQSVSTVGNSAFAGCSRCVIFCELDRQPNSWLLVGWKENQPVVWRCRHNNQTSSGERYIIDGGVVYKISDNVASIYGVINNATGIVIPYSITYLSTNYQVKSINSTAFEGCNYDIQVEYSGTISQWHSISDNTSWICPFEQVICSDGVTEAQ